MKGDLAVESNGSICPIRSCPIGVTEYLVPSSEAVAGSIIASLVLASLFPLSPYSYCSGVLALTEVSLSGFSKGMEQTEWTNKS